jgi:hypothetical protein
MSRTIVFDSEAVQHVPSTGGGVYATRRGRKSVDESLAKDQTKQTIDEENSSVIEKDVLDERDVKKKQVPTWTTSAGDPTANHESSRLEDGQRYGELRNIPVTSHSPLLILC